MAARGVVVVGVGVEGGRRLGRSPQVTAQRSLNFYTECDGATPVDRRRRRVRGRRRRYGIQPGDPLDSRTPGVPFKGLGYRQTGGALPSSSFSPCYGRTGVAGGVPTAVRPT